MKTYRFKYTGGMFMLFTITLLSLTVIFIPAALVLLLESIEIMERQSSIKRFKTESD